MPQPDHLQARYPALVRATPRLALATLPTPVHRLPTLAVPGARQLYVKQDNLSGERYGGNKVRKLEYLLAPALQRQRRVIATFGAAGSHHALATALYARQLGFDPVCFLSHQLATAGIAATLNLHLEIGSDLVPYGGRYARRIAILRRHLWRRRAWVVPTGGSSWRGTLGFVNAGCELAAQIANGECPRPDRAYVATGTMGTAAGLALGFALAGLHTEVHAIRVTHPHIASDAGLAHLVATTAAMLHRACPDIPADIATRVRLRLRHDFFAGGYARGNAATDDAKARAADEFGLPLETTYTAKAMAALLHDLDDPQTHGQTLLFWQTWHGEPLPVRADRPLAPERLNEEFLRYFP